MQSKLRKTKKYRSGVHRAPLRKIKNGNLHYIDMFYYSKDLKVNNIKK